MGLPNPPSINFFANATLLKDNKIIAKKFIIRGQDGYILGDQTLEQFIGEAEFILPEPIDTTPLELVITGKYSFNVAEGNISPSELKSSAIKMQIQAVEIK